MKEQIIFEPSRLSLARRRRGWGRPELARKSGIKTRTIVAYEVGERVPSEEALEALAAALGFPKGFFSGSPVERLALSGVSFRKLSKTTAGARDQALAAGELALALGDAVDERFELPDPDLPDIAPPPTPAAAARMLRVRWGLADKTIPNMVRLLEAHGVRVFSLAENTRDIDAFSFWRGETPYIFLNTLKSAEHSRFDAAHELGHLILHRHGEPANGRRAELEANAFASSFLMPKTSILAHAPKHLDLNSIVAAKRGWGVSAAALAHRLYRIGRISKWHYHSLCIQIQNLGYRNREPDPMPRELSSVWPGVFGALRSEGVTRADFARSLSFPLAELRGLVFQLVLSADETPSSDSPRAPTPMATPGKLSLLN